jgi:hypothetical protein
MQRQYGREIQWDNKQLNDGFYEDNDQIQSDLIVWMIHEEDRVLSVMMSNRKQKHWLWLIIEDERRHEYYYQSRTIPYNDTDSINTTDTTPTLFHMEIHEIRHSSSEFQHSRGRIHLPYPIRNETMTFQ